MSNQESKETPQEMSCIEIIATFFIVIRANEIIGHLKFRYQTVSSFQTGFFTPRITVKGPQVAIEEIKREIDAHNWAIDARY